MASISLTVGWAASWGGPAFVRSTHCLHLHEGLARLVPGTACALLLRIFPIAKLGRRTSGLPIHDERSGDVIRIPQYLGTQEPPCYLTLQD